MVFWSLCFWGAILAQKLNSFICEKKILIFWHPWDPWGRIHIDLNKNSVRTGCVYQTPIGKLNISLLFHPSVTEVLGLSYKYDCQNGTFEPLHGILNFFRAKELQEKIFLFLVEKVLVKTNFHWNNFVFHLLEKVNFFFICNTLEIQLSKFHACVKKCHSDCNYTWQVKYLIIWKGLF